MPIRNNYTLERYNLDLVNGCIVCGILWGTLEGYERPFLYHKIRGKMVGFCRECEEKRKKAGLSPLAYLVNDRNKMSMLSYI